jgi:hypothetical protein
VFDRQGVRKPATAKVIAIKASHGRADLHHGPWNPARTVRGVAVGHGGAAAEAGGQGKAAQTAAVMGVGWMVIHEVVRFGGCRWSGALAPGGKLVAVGNPVPKAGVDVGAEL